jgi:hypothetical protein
VLRLAAHLRSRSHDADFDAEIESHLQLHIDDHMRAGLSAADARRQALLSLGGRQRTREVQRDRRRVPVLDVLGRDVRFAVRQWRRSPGFAVAAMLVLALGMGASASMLAFVDAALLRPLPYADPSRLVDVTESVRQIPRANLSYADYVDWKHMSTSFTAFEAYTKSGFMMRTPSGARPINAARVTAGFFRVLGVAPSLGRDFRDAEAQPGAAGVAVLSHGAWLRQSARHRESDHHPRQRAVRGGRRAARHIRVRTCGCRGALGADCDAQRV